MTPIDEFYTKARDGALPRVTYIEPFWGGGAIWDTLDPLSRAVGNEFHPVQDMFCGEFFVKQIYEAVVNGQNADTTVLVITFDENGGTYDHFPPWKATPPNREPMRYLGTIQPPGRDGMPTTGTEYGFAFDCFGVRVPTLLISKYVKPGTIFRSPTEVPLDHTSVIATILKWLGIRKETWRLGERVANAPTFDGALMGTGEDEAERRKTATGLATFDERRKARITGKAPLTYGQTIYLRYIGNPWADPDEPAISDYLGGPETGYDKYWYPVGTANKGEALRLRFGGGTNGQPVKAGDHVTIETFGKTGAGKSLDGRTLAVSTSGSGWVTLYKPTFGKGNPSKWIPWLVHDRVPGVELYPDDEVFLFAQVYEFDVLAKNYNTHPQAGVIREDPFKRLVMYPVDPALPDSKRYAWWRAGEWDVWRIETD